MEDAAWGMGAYTPTKDNPAECVFQMSFILVRNTLYHLQGYKKNLIFKILLVPKIIIPCKSQIYVKLNKIIALSERNHTVI